MKNNKKHFGISIAIALCLLFAGISLFQISKSRTFQFFGGLVSRVDTSEKFIALTFDDAPTEYTQVVLDILKRENIKATFYIVGSALEQKPQVGKQITTDGHELGNHSYSHERFLLKSQDFIHEEIQKTNTLIIKTGYKGEITFRPPNGKKLIGLPWYLSKNKIKTIMWDVEPDTYIPSDADESQKTEFIISYTIGNAKPGSIILLHPFCKTCTSDRQAIPEIVRRLKAEGYTFVTISELLKYQ